MFPCLAPCDRNGRDWRGRLASIRSTIDREKSMRMRLWSALALSLIAGLLGAHPVRAATCVAWVSGGSYTAGEVVTYNGATYTALVAQTDYDGTGWNPTIASLFSPGGSCSGGTPPPPPPPAGITAGASYNIVNPLSGLVLDIAGCGNVN